MTVRVVTDSACDLPAHTVTEHRITVVPLTIRFGDQDFVDREQLTPAEFWSKCAAAAELPSTAAPAPGQFETTFRQLVAEGATSIVSINLSAALSATMQSAELAARSVADTVQVTVIDSQQVTLGIGVIVAEAARLARRWPCRPRVSSACAVRSACWSQPAGTGRAALSKAPTRARSWCSGRPRHASRASSTLH